MIQPRTTRQPGTNGLRQTAQAEEQTISHLRLAAVGDLHCTERSLKTVTGMFSEIEKRADVLLLCGNLTDRGRPAELEVLLTGLKTPLKSGLTVVSVLGNHDYHGGEQRRLVAMLRHVGVRVLFEDDNIYVHNERVGFCGIKGFWGGFDATRLRHFGETSAKEVVKETVREVRRLSKGLRSLSTPEKVVLMHYSPIKQTLQGESPEQMLTLGSELLAGPLDELRASVAFHGHSHFGKYNGITKGGVPVYNVAVPVLRRTGLRPPSIHLI